jgi:hypothetical protein
VVVEVLVLLEVMQMEERMLRVMVAQDYHHLFQVHQHTMLVGVVVEVIVVLGELQVLVV